MDKTLVIIILAALVSFSVEQCPSNLSTAI